MKRLLAYLRAHWKESLALALAAIPAAFVIFHKPTQQAAAGMITYIPSAFGVGGGDATTPTAAATSPGPATADASFPSFTDWLASGRPDILKAIQQKRWADLNGQYAKEALAYARSHPRTSTGGSTGTSVAAPAVKGLS